MAVQAILYHSVFTPWQHIFTECSSGFHWPRRQVCLYELAWPQGQFGCHLLRMHLKVRALTSCISPMHGLMERDARPIPICPKVYQPECPKHFKQLGQSPHLTSSGIPSLITFLWWDHIGRRACGPKCQSRVWLWLACYLEPKQHQYIVLRGSTVQQRV